jgi:hypothetical protein
MSEIAGGHISISELERLMTEVTQAYHFDFYKSFAEGNGIKYLHRMEIGDLVSGEHKTHSGDHAFDHSSLHNHSHISLTVGEN